MCAFCFSDYSFAVNCSDAGPPEAKVADRPSEKVVDKQTDAERALVVGLIDFQLKRISVFKEYALEHENLALDAEHRSLSLPPRTQPTNCSATMLTRTGNFIARWTNWSFCNGSAEAKTCRRLSTLIWGKGARLFAKQSQETL
jgi:hypothetical protein